MVPTIFNILVKTLVTRCNKEEILTIAPTNDEANTPGVSRSSVFVVSSSAKGSTAQSISAGSRTFTVHVRVATSVAAVTVTGDADRAPFFWAGESSVSQCPFQHISTSFPINLVSLHTCLKEDPAQSPLLRRPPARSILDIHGQSLSIGSIKGDYVATAQALKCYQNCQVLEEVTSQYWQL